MLAWIDRTVRGMVVVPLVLTGLALTYCAEFLIGLGAWIADVETGGE